MTIERTDERSLVLRRGSETVLIQPWGPDALRVRSTVLPSISDEPWALVRDRPADGSIAIEDGAARVTAGLATAIVEPDGRLRFVHTRTGAVLLEEEPQPHAWERPARHFAWLPGGSLRITVRFRAFDAERFYGLGQHQHGRLDQKGCVIALAQRNTEVTVPFLLSSRGYGLLWNNPAVGRVELARNGTIWVADRSRQIDYVVIAGDSPAAILGQYADLTGHAPPMPEWATGFWQSKLRYETQDELVAVAEEHRRRGLPLSVIVIDYFHWTRMGEWRFDPKCWPDPAAMVRRLGERGVRVMVSIWPSVSPLSDLFAEMQDRGLLVRTEQGPGGIYPMPDTGINRRIGMHYYDATNPEARRYLWEKVRDGYHRHGIRIWWLDACEPEMRPNSDGNLRYHLGNGEEVGCIYPFLHEQALADGMREAGERETFMLCRSAWAGSQRFGACVWSGDIESTFGALAAQVRAGLNMGLSGIPWWTTDIGGFYNGRGDDPSFRELLVRWFQYAVFCPLLRMHGFRLPLKREEMPKIGGDNEVWSFGDEVFRILREQLLLRERLRPYILAQMEVAHRTGLPPMRPLFVDFPGDAQAAAVDDEYLFGPEILVAPILGEGQRGRTVYLPSGADWRDAWTGRELPGGTTVESDAPLERIPVFLRGGAIVPIRGGSP